MKLKKVNTEKILIGSLFALGLFGLSAIPVIMSEMTFAEDCSSGSDNEACIKVEVTVPLYLSITNAASIPDTMDIDNSTDVSDSQEVIVGTNNGGGYYLTAKAISNDYSGVVSNKMLRRDSSGVALSDNGIQAVDEKTTLSSMADGHWGLALDGVNFRPIATTASGSGIINYSTAPVASSTTDVMFGAKNDASLASGVYSATIQFTALANDGTPKTLYGD